MSRLSIAIFFLCLYSATFGDDFDNRYFHFYKQQTMSVCWVYPPESEHHSSISFSEVTGHHLKDEKKFILNGAFSFKDSDFKDSYTVIYSKVMDSQYQFTMSFSSGVTGSGTLALKGQNQYEVIGSYSNQTSYITKGRIESDGKIYSKDKLVHKDGKLLCTGKAITEQKKVPNGRNKTFHKLK